METFDLSSTTKAGYDPGYLKDLINVRYIEDAGIKGTPDVLHMSYLDFVYEGPTDTKHEKYGDVIDRNANDVKASMIGLKTEVQNMKIKRVETSCPETEDPVITITREIDDQVFGLIHDLSLKNKLEMEASAALDLDVELPQDRSTRFRRLVSRVLAASNIISTRGRRGMATFLMVGEQEYNILNNKDFYRTIITPNMMEMNTFTGHLKMFGSNKLDGTVIVGRAPSQDDEPGIKLACNREAISGDIRVEIDQDIDIKYSYYLDAISSFAHRQYIQFDVK